MPKLTTNKKASFNYEVLETLDAGIALTGPEVKSAKTGNLNLQGAYVSLRENGLWLVHAYIAPYKPAAAVQIHYQPDRDRQLLVKRQEIASLTGKMRSAGVTLIPLRIYTNRGLVKVALGLARGKKAHDKRASIKKRETNRDMARAMRKRG